MQIGIIGLPKSGKTTVFNALTKGTAEIDTYLNTTTGPNIGVAKVPDTRLEVLKQIFQPKRVIPADVTYVDVPTPPKSSGNSQGITGHFLAYLSKVDALLHVVRAFQDARVPHIDGSINPERDAATMDLDLAFSDLAIIEKRLERIHTSLKAAKTQQREALSLEQTLLGRIKIALESETPIRELQFSQDERKLISNFQFLTAKPLLLVLNIGEEKLSEVLSLEEAWHGKHKRPQLRAVAFCGKLEMELSQLEDADAQEFRSSMGLEEGALDRMIKLSYELLGLISFFTMVSNEVKAWTVQRDTPAVKAAGKIHSDMEQGFIRAEVISYDDILSCGSIAEARKHGLLHIEGKNYTVRDGDIITFLFHV